MPAQFPEQCDELFGRYLNEGDLDRLAALYAPEASLVGQDGSPASGTKSIREALQGFIAQKPKITMKVTKVVRAGDNLAVLYNDWSAHVAGTEMKGKAIEVVQRQRDGTWLFLMDDPFARG
jgi:uncharacterized protein (TIGR02246 family)